MPPLILVVRLLRFSQLGVAKRLLLAFLALVRFMNQILEIAWEQYEKPFHAETIVPDDLIPISTLRQILISIVGHCELYYPSDYCTLYKFDAGMNMMVM